MEENDPNFDALKDAYEKVSRYKESSQNDYEKNLMYISAGTLVLSITFIEKITPIQDAIFLWIIVVSWFLLSTSIGINLFSYWLAIHQADKLQDSINASMTFDGINDQIKENNKLLKRVNVTTLATLFIGIICLVLYCSLNVLNMSKKRSDAIPIPSKGSEYLEKGRTMSPLFNPFTSQPTQAQQAQSDSTSGSSSSQGDSSKNGQ